MVSLQTALVAIVLSASGETVLLDFYSDSCPPCRVMAPLVQRLSEAGYPIRKVNVTRDRALAARYGIRRIPCFVMLVDGKEVDRVTGGTSYGRLERMCKLGVRHQAPSGTSPVIPASHATASKTGAPVSIPARQSGAPLSALTRPAAPQQPLRAKPQPASTTAQAPAPGWTPQGDANAESDARLMAASVRLRIQDPQGRSCGSGTIIDARNGEALILTCGHIFRDSNGEGRIEVDLFGPNAAEGIQARLISFDLIRDIGLLTIHTSGPVTVVPVAPPGYRVKPGDPVVSIGCNNGDRPSVRHSRVTSLNRYQGPDNVQVAGLPVEGRSGGGLFSEDGRLIGVCNAADHEDKEGLFAALTVAYKELDDAKLAFVYNRSQEAKPPAEPAALADLTPPPMAEKMPRPVADIPQAKLSEVSLGSTPPARWSSTEGAPPLNREEQAALDELSRRLKQGARVVCVVQPRDDPNARNEIIILDQASVQFLRQLTTEAKTLGNPPEVRPVSAETRDASSWRPGSTRRMLR